MSDISWNVFFQTGNIEAYLLMKELEVLSESTGTSLVPDLIEQGE
ncbi:YqzL family protein [Halobacillus naozhouensis]|uniref:YqzL family protein n=1 Tax=Halobacillus naozhouensis TaxID=554880 RepID=A0ABY8J2Y8_9BACI|nr:YqzL family protein [Halobacillus naozhouensis]WFT76845.1 YqzL family protein [Halobacillus naozhouensis]